MFEPRAYEVQLYFRRTQLRLDGAKYGPVDLAWGPDRAALDVTYARLEELFRRLTTLDGANRRELDQYELEIAEFETGANPRRWVPYRPDGEDLRWV